MGSSAGGPTEWSFSTELTPAIGFGAGEVEGLLGRSFTPGICTFSQSTPGIPMAASWSSAMT
eukprot:3699193-Rhodomonas_salina.1